MLASFYRSCKYLVMLNQRLYFYMFEYIFNVFNMIRKTKHSSRILKSKLVTFRLLTDRSNLVLAPILLSNSQTNYNKMKYR